MSKRIYLASSWRNPRQPALVDVLRDEGHMVYDFRNPPNKSGFAWSQIDPKWENWSTGDYMAALRDPIASHGFLADYRAMQWADTGVLLLPCGRSSHLEAGYFNGAGKRLVIYIPDGVKIEPELMYLMANEVVSSQDNLIHCLEY